ncbi:DegT/DnrJ/EryC1/StrS family aminotransferase [bacterium]|nr:DegT/DnrJ/EryC1/StrS family aminotransferase [bacterium]
MQMCNDALERSRIIHLNGTGAVAELEAKLARHYGVKHALCVSSATTGLLAIAIALGLRDQEFITSPYTYGGTISSWLLFGNTPVFADIDSTTLTLDPHSVVRYITDKSRAILGVDIYGMPSDMIALRKIADEHRLCYISDAAQSFGARRASLPASKLAHAFVVSFTAGKSLFAGEGGAILTDSSDLYEKLIWCCQHPNRQKRELGLHRVNEFGINGRIHPLAAVIANSNFDRALRAIASRQRKANRIIKLMNESSLVQPVILNDNELEPSHECLTGCWRSSPACEDLENELAAEGIRVRISDAPVRLIYNQPAFRSQCSDSMICSVAERQMRIRFSVTSTSDER